MINYLQNLSGQQSLKLQICSVFYKLPKIVDLIWMHNSEVEGWHDVVDAKRIVFLVFPDAIIKFI